MRYPLLLPLNRWLPKVSLADCIVIMTVSLKYFCVGMFVSLDCVLSYWILHAKVAVVLFSTPDRHPVSRSIVLSNCITRNSNLPPCTPRSAGTRPRNSEIPSSAPLPVLVFHRHRRLPGRGEQATVSTLPIGSTVSLVMFIFPYTIAFLLIIVKPATSSPLQMGNPAAR